MKYLILLLTLLCFSTLHAQNGWKDMGGYKETTDTTGEVLQIKPTTDGKYLYVLCTLMDSTVKKLALQKWDVDSGKIVYSRFIDTKGFAAVKVNLNCDAATYSMYAVPSASSVSRLLVKDNDSDTLLVSAIDKEDVTGKIIQQIDYDRTLNTFYIAYNGDYYRSSGAEYTTYSNGYITEKFVSDTVVKRKQIISSNTAEFIHTFQTPLVASLSYYHFNEYKKVNFSPTQYNDNLINYIGTSGRSINLGTYRTSGPTSNTFAVSPNGLLVASTNREANTTYCWYVDSSQRASQLGAYTKNSNWLVFSYDNNYLLVNSPSDSSIYTINPAMNAICGSWKNSIVRSINLILSVPNTSYVLALCTDKKFRLLNAISDTTHPKYSFTWNKTSIYQHDSIAFGAVVPSYMHTAILWNFGDGATSTSLHPYHTFENAGLYDISMTVADSSGNHEVIQKKLIEVKPTPNPITLDFDADVRYGSTPLKVNFTNKSTGTIVSYKWNFDDGTTSAAKDTVHVFKQPRSFSITLTVNNGIKDTSLTKLHYINADSYPTFLLNTKLIYNNDGRKFEFNGNVSTTTNVFETMLRSTTGSTFLKRIEYQRDVGNNIGGGGPFDNCGTTTMIYSLTNSGIDKKFIETVASFNPFSYNSCNDGTGVLGIVSNNLLSYFVRNRVNNNSISPPQTYLLNRDGNTPLITTASFPFYTMYYNVHPLQNTIDCYAFRKDRGLATDSTFLCFYTDTTKLLARDNIKGYALPAIETSGGRFMTVVSPISIDSTINRRLQLRWYDGAGTFLDSLVITRPTSDFIFDIAPLPNNRFMLSGNTTLYYIDSQGDSRRTAQGLIMIIDDKGTVEFTKQLPQWQTLKRIMPMDDRTFALTGTPTVAYPGFIAVKSDGKIIGDFRADVNRSYSNAYDGYSVTNCMNCVDVNFGKTMRTVFFTRNDNYNAELYVSENPHLKDISVSVDESPVTGKLNENQLTVSPNPTDGNSTLHYYSTTPQRITLTVTSLLGEVYRSQVLDVESGENLIPLDMSAFGSGVAFVTVAGVRDVVHAQIHILR
jgi:PKD repeat protein